MGAQVTDQVITGHLSINYVKMSENKQRQSQVTIRKRDQIA